jgi:hypothetical protein
MEYQDLTIDLQSLKGGKSFKATVAEAPLRDTLQVRFKKPLEQDELDRLLAFFNPTGEEAESQVAPPSSYKTGGQIFSKVFRDKLGKLFTRSRDVACRDGEVGLRLRFRFRRSDPLTGYLAAVPWEWLLDPETGEFLAIDRGTPIVREIAAARPRGILEVDPPLRILVVDAAPKTIHALNSRLEIDRIREALAPLISAGQVELIPLEDATANRLRDLLLKEEIHVLHFVGHGHYAPERGSGVVYFEKDDQTHDQVEGEMFASYLKGIPSLRLVVLNACNTACHAEQRHKLWSHGVASAILERTGVPAVIANQYSISDDIAVKFSSIFYERIAAGAAVDEAITETRLRLWGRTPEWATSILFLTAPNGRLFKINPKEVGKAAARVMKAPVETSEVRLGIKSIEGYGADMASREPFLDLLPYFKDRYNIQQQAWWQEKVFPELRDFLTSRAVEGRPLLLDFAAHSSIAFAAGWLLEPKSGFDVRVIQRTGNVGELNWHPRDGTEGDGPLWLDRPDIVLDPGAPDIAVALSVSQPNVADHVQEFVRAKRLRVGRIVDATIAPAPGPTSVRGGAHSIALAHALIQRLYIRQPHERRGRVHFFCAAPNALVFYLGQLASAMERIVLYEFPFRRINSFGDYKRSIVLPPPGGARALPAGPVR